MKIDELIAKEIEHFRPILLRDSVVPQSERLAWRQETIHARRSRVSREIFEMLGGVVRYGPFSGLNLYSCPLWGADDLGSMTMGFYEKEILDWLSNVRSDRFRTFVDIGAADGYYAVGLLSCLGFERSICFEMNEKSHEIIRKNAALNNCEGKITIKREASELALESMRKTLDKECLILCDIEGAEFELWTERVFEICQHATIIVEIHHWVEDFSHRYQKFLRIASQFFNISIIKPVPRDVSSIPELRDFTDDNRYIFLSERRPAQMRFLLMEPSR